jgi:chromosomal replication initiation ATPase DnaA
MQVGTYEAQQRAKALELRRKFYPTSRTPIFKPQPITELPNFIQFMPSWKKEELHFDEHMMEWRRMVRDEAISPIASFIRRRAAQLGFTYSQITKRGRGTVPVSHARFLIWWEIKNYVRPDLSYPEIGRLSGGFDHASVHHGVRKVNQWKSEMMEGKR